MEPILDRLPFTPKRVTAQQQPQFWPDMTMPHHPTVQPIWGHTVTELFDGGDPWHPYAEPEIARKPGGAPRNLTMLPSAYKGGEYEVEPDPAISSKAKTGHLVRAMWRAGWTREQAEDALMERVHDGGLYFRWRGLTPS